MKREMILSLMLIALALVNASASPAQTSKRIQFAKGKSSAALNGTTGANGVSYLVRAKSGQKLILTLTPAAKVGIKVETNGRFGEMVLLREEKGGTYEIGLEETGDYVIFIGSNGNKSVSFSLNVKIGKLADV